MTRFALYPAAAAIGLLATAPAYACGRVGSTSATVEGRSSDAAVEVRVRRGAQFGAQMDGHMQSLSASISGCGARGATRLEGRGSAQDVRSDGPDNQIGTSSAYGGRGTIEIKGAGNEVFGSAVGHNAAYRLDLRGDRSVVHIDVRD